MSEVKPDDEVPVLHHWFLMSFVVPLLGFTSYSAKIVNSDSMNLTMPKMLSIREQCQVEQEAVMLAVSYLGFMTTDDMKGKRPPEPVVIRENNPIYLEGYTEGLLGDLAVVPMNPYSIDSNPEATQEQATDWINGFCEGSNKQRERVTQKSAGKKLHAPPQ